MSQSEIERLTRALADRDARIADLEAVIGLNEDNVGVAFRLSSSLTKLLGCLLNMPNVTPDMITLRLNIASDSKVAIHRLREALKPHNIEVLSRRGLGYWISAEDKEKIWAITRGVTAAPAEAEETVAA